MQHSKQMGVTGDTMLAYAPGWACTRVLDLDHRPDALEDTVRRGCHWLRAAMDKDAGWWLSEDVAR
jgi:hypothetical protein